MNQPDNHNTAGKPRKHGYGLLVFVLFYNAIMIIVSCFYHTAIMDPWQLLWGLLFTIGGPVIVIAALVELCRLFMRSRLSPLRVLSPVLGILSVVIWSFGFWGIGSYFRPKLFGLVAQKNEQRAIEAIKNMEDPNRVVVRGFRYPYCRMFTDGRYKDGALFLVVPSAPGPKDTILFDPNNVVSKEGWDHLSGPWYYRYDSR